MEESAHLYFNSGIRPSSRSILVNRLHAKEYRLLYSAFFPPMEIISFGQRMLMKAALLPALVVSAVANPHFPAGNARLKKSADFTFRTECEENGRI